MDSWVNYARIWYKVIQLMIAEKKLNRKILFLASLGVEVWLSKHLSLVLILSLHVKVWENINLLNAGVKMRHPQKNPVSNMMAWLIFQI